MNNRGFNGTLGSPADPVSDVDFDVAVDYEPWLQELVEGAARLSAFVADPEEDLSSSVQAEVLDASAFDPVQLPIQGLQADRPAIVLQPDESYVPWRIPGDHGGEDGVGERYGVPAGSGTQMWRFDVTIDFAPDDPGIAPVPVTNSVVGTLSSSGEEGVNKSARIVLRPFGPDVDVFSSTMANPLNELDIFRYFNKPVTITHILVDANGLPLTNKIIFTGFVDDPDYDVASKLLTLTCSDQRAKQLRNMTKGQVDALTPGAKWHPALFDEEADTAEYAEDRLSTVPYALDIDNRGRWKWTPWRSKSEADFTYTDSSIIYESLQIEMASGSGIVNCINLDVDYSFPRLKRKYVHFSWSFGQSAGDPLSSEELSDEERGLNEDGVREIDVAAEGQGGTQGTAVEIASGIAHAGLAEGGGTLCDYLGRTDRTYHPLRSATYTIPTTDMIMQAAEGTGWCLESFSYVPSWRSQFAICPNVAERAQYTVKPPYAEYSLFINDEADKLPLSVSGRLRKHAQQPVTEKYRIVFKSAGSVGIYGPQDEDLPFSLTANADIDDFINDECCEPKTRHWLAYPRGETDEEDHAYYLDADTSQFITDDTSRKDFGEVMDILRCQADVLLRDAHRENRVLFRTCLNPLVERHHTVEVNDTYLKARGKVFGYSHVMNTETGEAFTEIELAISYSGDSALGAPATEYKLPGKPAVPLDTVSTAPYRLSLGNRYGGISMMDRRDDDIAREAVGVEGVPAGQPTWGGVGGRGRGVSPFDKVSEPDPETLSPCDENFGDIWDGYVGNRVPADHGSVTYSERFVIKIDQFDERDTEQLQMNVPEVVYELRIPDDLFEIYV